MGKLTRKEVIEKVKRVESLERADLEFVDLSKADLSGADLSRANLSGANLSNAVLRGANLSNAVLRGANLSEANLFKANLSNAVLRGTNLSNAALSQANLASATLNDANLTGADLCYADLSGADLRNADLLRANLSDVNLLKSDLRYANLSGANLSFVDLAGAIIKETKILEEDLDGVDYRPEQLASFIIERKTPELLNIPKGKGLLTVKIDKDDMPLLQLIMLTAFIEAQYDIFYIFLFSEYESIDKLKEMLNGSLYHKLQGSEDAIKITDIKRGSWTFLFIGSLAVSLPLKFFVDFYKATPEDIKKDIYFNFRKLIFKTKKEKYEEEVLKAQVMKEYTDVKIKCREVGEAPVDFLPPGEDETSLPPALLKDTPQSIAENIERHQNFLSTRMPRKDYLLTIKKLREEGMLTNKLDDAELANLLEVLNDDFGSRYESLHTQLGAIEVDVEMIDK
jgi:uncharacterized protein YjbI with pentapeptide repeats